MRLKIQYRKMIAGVTVYAHLIVYGLGGTAVAGEVTDTSDSQGTVSEKSQGPPDYDGGGQDSGMTAGVSEQPFSDSAGNDESGGISSENSYYGGGYQVNQGNRRGAGTSSGSVKKTQRRRIDTTESVPEPQAAVSETLVISGNTAVGDGEADGVSAPGLRLGARGRKIAIVASAVVVGVVSAVVYLSFLRHSDSSNADRVPQPPDPPEI